MEFEERAQPYKSCRAAAPAILSQARWNAGFRLEMAFPGRPAPDTFSA
jgi:hypothetical protein